MVRVKFRFRVYILHLIHFYQAYCTHVVHHCYVTGGILISFQISDLSDLDDLSDLVVFTGVLLTLVLLYCL